MKKSFGNFFNILLFPVRLFAFGLRIFYIPEDLKNFRYVQDVIFMQNDIGLPFDFGVKRGPVCKTKYRINKIFTTTEYGICGPPEGNLTNSYGKLIKKRDKEIFVIPGGYILEYTDISDGYIHTLFGKFTPTEADMRLKRYER